MHHFTVFNCYILVSVYGCINKDIYKQHLCVHLCPKNMIFLFFIYHFIFWIFRNIYIMTSLKTLKYSIYVHNDKNKNYMVYFYLYPLYNMLHVKGEYRSTKILILSSIIVKSRSALNSVYRKQHVTCFGL